MLDIGGHFYHTPQGDPMRKSILSLALSAAFAVPGIAAAQAPAPGPVTANVTVASDYRFRGLTQTMKRPAIQGGFDYAHSSGLYLGNWNSNVSSAIFGNGNLEMDFYGGYKPTFGDITGDIGFIYYYYPGTLAAVLNGASGETHTGKIDNKEIYAGAAWKWVSAKLYWAIDDLFSIPGTRFPGPRTPGTSTARRTTTPAAAGAWWATSAGRR
jgi:uncharacterized protein (TIGR02001 family)